MDKRRILKTAIITSLLSSYVFPTYGAVSFNDVEESFAKDAIFQLANKGIISGKGNGKFDPKGYVARQDFAIILAKALNLGSSDFPAIPTFSDIPSSHYAYKYVEAVAKAGLIKGNKNGQFGNGEKLSRQDMAVILVRALGINPVGEAKNIKFKDANQIADYAKDSVGYAVKLGLINGNSEGYFNPQENTDRQSVAKATNVFLNELNRDIVPSLLDQPTISFESADALVFTYKENLDQKIVPELKDIIVLGDRGQKITIKDGGIRIEGKKVFIKFSDAVLPGHSIKVSYTPSEKKITSTSGKTSPEIVKQEVIYKAQNHIPREVKRIADKEMSVDSKNITIDLNKIFEDEDQDTLFSSAISTDPSVAVVDTSGMYLTIKAVKAGTATITVMVNDNRGGSAKTSFLVKVNDVVNHAPRVNLAKANEIGTSIIDQRPTVGKTVKVYVVGLFQDEERDNLTLSVSSEDENIAKATITREGWADLLTITPIRAGKTLIVVKASDGVNQPSGIAFNVPVIANHDPTINLAKTASINKAILDQSPTIGKKIEMDITGMFEDEDGNVLTLEASSENADIATATIREKGDSFFLTITPVNSGSTAITVIAYDGHGGSAKTKFDITVR